MSQENRMTVENHNETINNTSYATATKSKKKSKRKNKSDLGPDFVAPDGGWGWVVCIAAGLSTFSIFPSLQQYGILYRNRLHELGFEGRQITSIVNMELATSTLIGVVNGAMFRRFTFRQVALAGGLLVTIGISLTAFCRGFLQYAICFSLIYGMGIGLNTSATALAVNTYFKKYRRHAMSVTWTITGIGPIVFPHISTFLIQTYSFKLAILIIAAISLNTLICGSTLQPVLWHVRSKKGTDDGDDHHGDNDGGDSGGNKIAQDRVSIGKENDFECKYCQYNKDAKRNIFASQYLFNDNDPDRPGYEIIEPATPMLARANDGWFGEKILSNVEQFKMNRRFSTATKSVTNVQGNRDDGEVGGGDCADDCGDCEFERSRLEIPQNGANYFNQEREEREHYLNQAKGDRSLGGGCTCAEERVLLENSIKAQQSQNGIDDHPETRPMTFKRKVIKFFDLDLLRDLTFVNLVQGMTIMMFGEMNFSFLTPFILSSYGYENKQISLAMSLLGGMDITMRFLAPFLLGKVKFGNSTLFAFGIVLITVARCLVTFTRSYYVMCGLFMVIGFGKAFRTIFAPLIIPSYVPLHRLPAASGLQLVCNTILSLVCGPLLGVIADSFGYNFSIHFINLTSMLALSLWILEWFVRRMLGKPKSHTQQH